MEKCNSVPTNKRTSVCGPAAHLRILGIFPQPRETNADDGEGCDWFCNVAGPMTRTMVPTSIEKRRANPHSKKESRAITRPHVSVGSKPVRYGGYTKMLPIHIKRNDRKGIVIESRCKIRCSIILRISHLGRTIWYSNSMQFNFCGSKIFELLQMFARVSTSES